jgi:hypothetical protein
VPYSPITLLLFVSFIFFSSYSLVPAIPSLGCVDHPLSLEKYVIRGDVSGNVRLINYGGISSIATVLPPPLLSPPSHLENNLFILVSTTGSTSMATVATGAGTAVSASVSSRRSGFSGDGTSQSLLTEQQ